MDILYESGLFAELAEVMGGHDPELYEDIPKQPDLCTLSTSANDASLVTEDFISAAEQPDLITQGQQLLDQLMAVSDLQLPVDDPIDFADVDEVSLQDSLVGHELLSDLHALAGPSNAEYPAVSSPAASDISTLPSEPSSPADFFNSVPDTSIDGSNSGTGLTDLLQSLFEDNADSYNDYSQDGDDNSWCSSPTVCSPVPSVGQVSLDSEFGKSKPKKSKSTPYSKLPANKKERKKKQNKEAAIRYREKKRQEAQGLLGEEQEKERKNQELKTEVLNLEREIMCMKELLSDVFNIHSL